MYDELLKRVTDAFGPVTISCQCGDVTVMISSEDDLKRCVALHDADPTRKASVRLVLTRINAGAPHTSDGGQSGEKTSEPPRVIVNDHQQRGITLVTDPFVAGSDAKASVI